jgi:signal transduction histidine kinase
VRARGIRRLQWAFAALLVVCVAELAWWMFDSWAYTRAAGRRLEAQWEHERAAAAAMLEAGIPPARVRHLLPDLEPGPDGALRPSQAARDALESERKHRLRRWAWEGAFFLAVLLGAIGVLGHALRREAELRRRQQNFLASVGHEFKSPIASLMLDAGTLSLRDPPAETRRRLLGRMGDTLARLEGMVANLLETARLEEGHFVQDPRALRLAPALRAVAASVQSHAAGRVAAIEQDVPEELVVRADDAAVGTVMRNLLENAIKAQEALATRVPHTHGAAALAVAPPAPIRVVARAEGKMVRVEVIDAGEGFEPSQGDRLFEKFYRPGHELRRGGRGSGLGLYIVRQLVERGGGRVGARSDGPGRGATFTVRWPREEETE